MTQYSNIRIEPAYDRWSDWVTVFHLENSRLNVLRSAARARLIESAQSYVLKLNAIADDAGLKENPHRLLTGDAASDPIVMTGHQPVIFHPGLSFKYQVTEQVASANNAIAVSVIIDTDQGDSGQFTFPKSQSDNGNSVVPGFPISREVQTLAKSHNLFVHGRLQSPAIIEQQAEAVVQQLKQLPTAVSVPLATDVFAAYEKLAVAKCSSAEANTIIRSLYGIGGRLLEIPLSAIASFPETLSLTADILKQSQRFANAYNSALKLFREEHGIRNAANPFPDLKVSDARCELPFWVVDHDSEERHVLEVAHNGDVTQLIANDRIVDTFTGSISADALEPMLLQNIQLVPRGALITAFLRMLFSDLFVHGVGGARYDQFTDEFIRSWWNCEPPPFTLATASRYAFPEQKQRLENVQALKDNLRDMQFNSRRYFGQKVFPEELEATLKELSDKKLALVDQLKEAKSKGESAGEFGRQIQDLTEQIKTAVSDHFNPELQLLDDLTPEQIDTVNSRTYPWFLFEPIESMDL